MTEILADTSVWINHFRQNDLFLADLLVKGKIVCHPFIVGEIACGHLKNRTEIINLLPDLPIAKTADIHDVLKFIEHHRLMGLGIGIVDIHLLLSAVMSNVLIWSEDKRLNRAAEILDVLFKGV